MHARCASIALQHKLSAQQTFICNLGVIFVVYQKLGKDCNAYPFHLDISILPVLQALLAAFMPSHLLLWGLQNLSAAVLSVGQACDSAGHRAWLPVGPPHPAARHHQPQGHVWQTRRQVCCQGQTEDANAIDCKALPPHFLQNTLALEHQQLLTAVDLAAW